MYRVITILIVLLCSLQASVGYSQCSGPLLLPVANLGTDSVTLQWFHPGSNADSFAVDIAPSSSDLDGIPDFSGFGGDTVRLGMLASGTSYHFKLRAYCGNETSPWSPEGVFVTDLNNPSTCPLQLPLTDNNCNNGYFPDRYYLKVDQSIGDSLGIDVFLESVSLIIEHYWPADLSLELTAPSGSSITLFADAPIGGNHFGNFQDTSCTMSFQLSDFACARYDTASPPFINTFRPLNPISDLYDSSSANGRWMLSFCDRASNAAGENAFLKHIELDFAGASCRPPTNIQVHRVSDSTLYVQRDVPEPTDSIFAVMIPSQQPAAWPPPSNALVHEVSTSSERDTLTGLVPATSYQLYYVNACEGQFSETSCPTLFSTACAPIRQFSHFDDRPLCDELCHPDCTIDSTWSNTASSYWSLSSGATATPGTGPDGDVHGSGQYVYHEASPSLCNQGAAVLQSSCLEVISDTNQCDFSFSYHMYGLDVGTLTLQYSDNNGQTWHILWEQNGDQGNQWQEVSLSLDTLQGQSIKLRFVSSHHDGSRADVALDELQLTGVRVIPPTPFYPDNDGDGYGVTDSVLFQCLSEPPSGYVALSGDCNDADSTINPGADEIHCNLIDENCNGLQDDPVQGGLTYSVDSISEIHCAGDSTGYIELSASGGVPPYSFSWNDGSDSSVISGRSQGVYYCTITDESGCMIRTEFFELSALVSLNFNLLQYERPDCSSGNNGALELGVGGGTKPYSIHWNTGDTTAFIDSLAPGDYKATVTEHSGCTYETRSYTVQARSSLETFILKESPDCNGNQNGALFLQINGGVPPYSYAWSTGDTTKNISGLSGGVYAVTITDAEQCIRILDSIDLQAPDSLQLNIEEVREVRCYGQSNGLIDIEVSGGAPPYSYQWTNGQQNYFTEDLQGLSAGTYHLSISDQNGCSLSPDSILLDQPDPIQLNEFIIDSSSCINSRDGSIDVSVHGGSPPYQYVWSDTQSDSSALDSLNPGNYSLTVVDASNCRVDTFSFQVPNLDNKIPVSLSVLDTPDCAGTSNGTLIAEYSEAEPPVQYLWNTGEEGLNATGTDTIDSLGGGEYGITITDPRGCTGFSNIHLPEPNPIVIDSVIRSQPSCHGADDGSIRIYGTGGTPPLSYAWSQGDSSYLADSLSAGAYSVIISDVNDCRDTAGPFLLDQPDSIVWNLSVQNADPGQSNGRISWNILGGTPPFTASWDPMKGALQGQSIIGLPADTYALTLTDQEACRVDTIIKVDESVHSMLPEDQSGFALYPIPSREKCYIKNRNNSRFTWSLYSISGEKISSGRNQSGKNIAIVNCQSLQSGMYLLRVRTDKGRHFLFKLPVVRK